MGGSVSKIFHLKVFILMSGAFYHLNPYVYIYICLVYLGRRFAGLFVPMDPGLHFLHLHGPGAVALGSCSHIPLAMAPERWSHW